MINLAIKSLHWTFGNSAWLWNLSDAKKEFAKVAFASENNQKRRPWSYLVVWGRVTHKRFATAILFRVSLPTTSNFYFERIQPKEERKLVILIEDHAGEEYWPVMGRWGHRDWWYSCDCASNAAMINGHHYEYILIHHLGPLMHLGECII